VDYIKRYQIIYRRVLKEAKKKENDRFVMSAKNKTKAMWQLINKHVGNSLHDEYKIDLRNGKGVLSNPQNVSDRLNSFFVEIDDDLLHQNGSHVKIQTCSKE
jgi:hypothetical protein